MHVTIPGRFPGLNEYIDACRRNRYKANRMKRSDQTVIAKELAALRHPPLSGRVRIHYAYYEPTRKRDLDNISGYFHKVFQDALVESGLIGNDGWKNVAGFSDSFFLDTANPRIEVDIEEDGTECPLGKAAPI